MCACLPQHPWLFIFSSQGHDRQSSDQNFSSLGYDRQSSEQNNRKLISLDNNGEYDIHAHGSQGLVTIHVNILSMHKHVIDSIFTWIVTRPCARICRFLVVGNIFRLETCMNSLVKVPPYSKLNFHGKILFTQSWCNYFKY